MNLKADLFVNRKVKNVKCPFVPRFYSFSIVCTAENNAVQISMKYARNGCPDCVLSAQERKRENNNAMTFLATWFPMTSQNC